MLTVMCPNCRHSFSSTAGCAGCTMTNPTTTTTTTTTTVSFDHHMPTSASGGVVQINTFSNLHRQQVTISTQIETRPNGFVGQNSNNGARLERTGENSCRIMPKLEIISKLSGGGCVVQSDCPYSEPLHEPLLDAKQLRQRLEKAAEYQRTQFKTARPNSPPSGCQELPGTRSEETCECRCFCRCSSYCRGGHNDFHQQTDCRSQQPDFSRSLADLLQPPACSAATSRSRNFPDNQHATSNIVKNSRIRQGDVEIQVNATVRIPATTASGTLNSCTLSITASTSSTGASSNPPTVNIASVNNLHGGGGIVGFDFDTYGFISDFVQTRDCSEEEVTTPVSWISCSRVPYRPLEPSMLTVLDLAKLAEVKSKLQMSGWYHEEISWQNCESMLKNEPIGRWFMRNSSDKRYAFALSVQTKSGPTSIRVVYSNGKFRLESEARLTTVMPVFDCPIQMMEYYRDYTNKVKLQRREVIMVDCFGVKFTKICLTEPILKEVRSLQHLARIEINKNKANLNERIERLASSHKQYLAEYPYTV